MRSAIVAFLRFCLTIFFRRIEILGGERVPREGAVVFAVNHPNGLIDPLFLLCLAPRPVSFLAKAPLFSYPVIGWIVRTLDSIPVYRKQDNTTGTNAETFARARAVLRGGGTIAIFPEGTTHDDPHLRELKSGAARIALGSRLPRVSIVPAGIYYTAKQRFRSAALVAFGEPIAVEPLADDGTVEPPAPIVDALTDRIDAGLDSVTLQADSQAALALIARAEDIFTADEELPLATELEIRRRFVDGYHELARRDPQKLAALQSRILRYEAELRQSGIDVHDLEPRIRAGRLLRLAFLLPPAAVGALVNYPTYRLVGALANRLASGELAMIATMKFIGALALFPLSWLAIAGAIAMLTGPVPALAALLLLPLFAWIALRVFEEIDGTIGDLRALAHSVLRRRGHEALISERKAIRSEIVESGRTLEGAGSPDATSGPR